MTLIDKAITFAAMAHKDQKRKSTDCPYITHPYCVGMILAQEGCNVEMIAAGLLHDTIEDTEVTLEDIKREFGEAVAEIVMGCSEPNKDLSWEERKQHTLKFLVTASDEIWMVSCADKLHNVRSMIKDYSELGDELWSRFKRGKTQQEWYLRGIVDSLRQGPPFRLIDELEQEIDRLFTGSDRIRANRRESTLKSSSDIEYMLASVGGYFGPSYLFEADRGTGTITYTCKIDSQDSTDDWILMEQEAWDRLHEGLMGCNFNKWHERYVNPHILDGTNWYVEVRLKDGTVVNRKRNIVCIGILNGRVDQSIQSFI